MCLDLFRDEILYTVTVAHLTVVLLLVLVSIAITCAIVRRSHRIDKKLFSLLKTGALKGCTGVDKVLKRRPMKR